MVIPKAACLPLAAAQKRSVMLLMAAVMAAFGAAEGEESGGAQPRIVSIGGELSYRVMQLVNTVGANAGLDIYVRNINWDDRRTINREWNHRVSAEALVTITPKERIYFRLGYRAGQGAGLSECRAVLSNNAFMLEGGILKFRYNPDARNLGEYLILSGAYPGFVFSGREWANNVGLHLRTTLGPHLTHDVLALVELENIPFNDISLVYIASYSPARALTLGAGVSFHRLIPFNPDLTTPPPENAGGEQIEFTHRGVKLMGRMSFDVKPLLGSPGLFGPEDLKIYAEAAVLGVKDYPVYYDNIRERIPVMVGLNVPAFNILDYIAVEGEWYGSPHLNTTPLRHYRAIPIEPDIGDRDDLKWSVSIKRAIDEHIAVYGRVANDHLRTEDASGGVSERELMMAPENWYWSIAVTLTF